MGKDSQRVVTVLSDRNSASFILIHVPLVSLQMSSSFQRQVCRDVSAATRVPLDRFHIVSVRAGEGHSHSVVSV
jgi:hypothetical protein